MEQVGLHFRQLPMQDMGPGSYVVEWRGLGTDGHALNGTFNFTVKQ